MQGRERHEKKNWRKRGGNPRNVRRAEPDSRALQAGLEPWLPEAPLETDGLLLEGSCVYVCVCDDSMLGPKICPWWQCEK